MYVAFEEEIEEQEGGQDAAVQTDGKYIAEKDEQELVLGADDRMGMMSLPRVKILLVLVCAVQVRPTFAKSVRSFIRSTVLERRMMDHTHPTLSQPRN